VAAVIAVAFVVEQGEVADYVTDTYAAGRIDPDLTPVVDQPLNEGFRAVSLIGVDPPCPVRAVGLVIDGPPPATLKIGGRATPLAGTVARLSTRPRPSDPEVQVYRLGAPLAAPFDVVADVPFAVGASVENTDPHLAFPGTGGDPVARLYCQVADSERARFEQQFPPLHPSQLNYTSVRLWPRVWAVLGILGLVATIGAAVRRRD
jgi:hypothetical protein